ncbi:MAG: hypothetical protein RIR45_949 [Pseudomonadota bacterium]|jgi:hypothetical protein
MTGWMVVKNLICVGEFWGNYDFELFIIERYWEFKKINVQGNQQLTCDWRAANQRVVGSIPASRTKK